MFILLTLMVNKQAFSTLSPFPTQCPQWKFSIKTRKSLLDLKFFTTMALWDFWVHYSSTHKSSIVRVRGEGWKVEIETYWTLLVYSEKKKKEILIVIPPSFIPCRYPTSSSSRTYSYFQSRQVFMRSMWHCKCNYSVQGVTRTVDGLIKTRI